MVLSTTDSFSKVGIKDETRDLLPQEDFISFAINVSILMKPANSHVFISTSSKGGYCIWLNYFDLQHATDHS
jgi:hypothetical protein